MASWTKYSDLAVVSDTAGMSAQWTPVVSVIGSISAALVGGLIGGTLSRRHEADRWTRDQRATAYADLIRSYADVYHRLALDEHGTRGIPDWPDWNRALAVVYMLADPAVAEQARQVDAAVWKLSLHAKTGRLPGVQWRSLRAALEAEVLTFLNLARTELGGGPALPALWGRPDPSWPGWEEPSPTSGP